MVCSWCDEGSGCLAVNEAECDFKTVEKTPSAIKARMDAEHKAVFDLISEDYATIEQMRAAKFKMNDKLHGIRVMKEVYEKEFNLIYEAPGRLQFTHKMIDFMIKAKKLERGSK